MKKILYDNENKKRTFVKESAVLPYDGFCDKLYTDVFTEVLQYEKKTYFDDVYFDVHIRFCRMRK